MKTISKNEATNATRVLIINVTRIGDTILATPAIRAIARYFPSAHITCLGHPKRVEVVEHLAYLAKAGSITKRQALYRGWADLLHGQEYDWAFIWGSDSALVRYAMRKARHVVAEQQTDASLNDKLFCAVQLPPRSTTHAVMWVLGLTQAVGIPDDGYRLDYCVTHDEIAWAKGRLKKVLSGDEKTGPRIGMQVASFATKSYRDWPIEHFIALVSRILQLHPGARFFLYGAAEDNPRIEKITDRFPDNATSFAGELTLRETVAIMSETDAYVGVDTGPTHLFGALQKPMVVMYHPTLPSGLFKPLQHSALLAIDHPLAGRTSDQEISIGEISVDVVFSALSNLLDARYLNTTSNRDACAAMVPFDQAPTKPNAGYFN